MISADTKTDTRERIAGTQRYDIQLLRAFAVIAVVGYHFEISGFELGFLGVDIFLVISGYLVGGMLLREIHKTGRLDLKRFFTRRIKRLLPASLFVVFGTIVFLQVSNQLTVREIWHGIWSSLYVQNLNLSIEGSSYLDQDLPPSFFVHFWLLSVEEQFYVLTPLIILILYSLGIRKNVYFVLALIGVLSFAFSIYLTQVGDASAYYSLASRTWQFLAGMLVAHLVVSRNTARVLWLLAAASTSVFVAGEIFGLETQFPGPGAALPTAVSSLALVAGTGLSLRLPIGLLQSLGVALGNMSYSIYLVHFPISIMFLRCAEEGERLPVIAVGILSTLFLAAISKLFIEDPFRYGYFDLKRFRLGATAMLAATLALVGTLALIALSYTSQP